MQGSIKNITNQVFAHKPNACVISHVIHFLNVIVNYGESDEEKPQVKVRQNAWKWFNRGCKFYIEL